MKKISIIFSFILFLGSPLKAEEVKDILNNLYFYRPSLTNSIKTISQISPDSIFNNLKNVDPRSLNYIGYYFLAEKDKRAIPLLIEFMNPEYQKENRSEATYNDTWTLLQMAVSSQFVISNQNENTWYNQFKTWWRENNKDFNLTMEDSTLDAIFQNIKTNEDKTYKKSW